MNNNMEMNSIILIIFCLNAILKMHECMRLWGCMDQCIDYIWNNFF